MARIYEGELKVIRQMVLPVMEHWVCPECEKGLMIGIPPQAPNALVVAHKCNNPECGNEALLKQMLFPQMSYVVPDDQNSQGAVQPSATQQ